MKNQIKLFCIALAGAFMLTACGGPKLIGVTLPETPLVLATGETATAETSYTYDGETPENAQPGSGLYQRRCGYRHGGRERCYHWRGRGRNHHHGHRG